jgi:hypothetical protein
MYLKRLFITTSIAIASFCVLPTMVDAALPIKTGMDVKEMQRLDVNAVHIDEFAGTVVIKSKGTGKGVRVSLKGPDELLNRVIVTTDHVPNKGDLYVAFEHEVPTLKDPSTLELTIEMPATMPLTLNLEGGKADIENRETKDTKINVNGFGDIRVASVKGVESSINGSGEITFFQINGDAKIAVRGDGKFALQNGKIDNLKASIQGTGWIRVEADVKDADLSTEGEGSITLANLSGQVKQVVHGSGEINIGKGKHTGKRGTDKVSNTASSSPHEKR